MKPYVGATGYKTEQEVLANAEVYEKNGFADGPYQAMFGFLCNSRQLALPKYSGPRNPAVRDLESLMQAVPSWAVPMIHFDTRDPARLKDDVIYLLGLTRQLANHVCKGIQLNVEWPRPRDIGAIKDAYSGVRIVLQIEDKPYLETEFLAALAREYRGLVDYCLIDPSRGYGKDFEMQRSLDLMHRCSDSLPDAIIGVAGGFDGTNVGGRVKQIQQGYNKPFFIDAEAKLRNKSDLALEACEHYIRNAGTALGTRQ